MTTKKAHSNKKIRNKYSREQYAKIFFPSSHQKEFPQTETPYELGVKLANEAVSNLKESLNLPTSSTK